MSRTPRYYKNPAEDLLSTDAHSELLVSLERILTHNPPTNSTKWDFHGFYTGPTSVAYLFYRLCKTYPDLEVKKHSLLNWAYAYLSFAARTAKQRPPDPDHCGIASEIAAQLSLFAVMQQDPTLVQQLCSFESTLNKPGLRTLGSNEWLYGRAGYLYHLRLCREGFSSQQHPSTSELLESTIRKTVTKILSMHQPWLWHGKQYLGAAHGTIGIICQIVLSLPSVAPQVRDLLSSLLDTQLESGNFPSSLPAGRDDLVQFCHGGPGFVLSLRSLVRYFPDLEDKIRNAISLAQRDIRKRGLLTKKPCLCHGVSGNALGLDDDRQFIHLLSFSRASSMAQIGWTKEVQKGEDVSSLYTAGAGHAWSWAVADKGLPKTCIGYNDI